MKNPYVFAATAIIALILAVYISKKWNDWFPSLAIGGGNRQARVAQSELFYENGTPLYSTTAAVCPKECLEYSSTTASGQKLYTCKKPCTGTYSGEFKLPIRPVVIGARNNRVTIPVPTP